MIVPRKPNRTALRLCDRPNTLRWSNRSGKWLLCWENPFLRLEEFLVRRPLIAGNWKMNLTRSGAASLARELAGQISGGEEAETALCPPFVYLDAVRTALEGSSIGLGAQNMYHEAEGAFTG